MDGKLPAFSPKDEEFFNEASKLVLNQREKYLRVIRSDDFIMWDNSNSIQKLIDLAKEGKRFAKSNNPISEVKTITELLRKFIDGYGEKGSHFADSQIMFNRGLIDGSYTKAAAELGSDITFLASCVDTILYPLENATKD